MKRNIQCSRKTYDYQGYVIQNDGYGFQAYLKGKKVGPSTSTPSECEEYIDSLDDSLDEVCAAERDYFGKEEAAEYGETIIKALAGKTVSKLRATAEQPGGLVYEADKLGIDMWDLLRALEGLCYEGKAQEIDDSTYKIFGSISAASVGGKKYQFFTVGGDPTDDANEASIIYVRDKETWEMLSESDMDITFRSIHFGNWWEWDGSEFSPVADGVVAAIQYMEHH